jgi:hypothetical protein
MEDTTLQGTLTSPLAAKKKNRLRQYTIDLMQKYRDPKFAKYALYATNEFDPAAIEQELEYYNQFVSGQDTSTNKVTIGGRTHEIKTLADEKALQDIQVTTDAAKEEKVSTAQTLSGVKLLENKILENQGFTGAVGASFNKNIPGWLKPGKETEAGLTPGTQAVDFENQHNQLIGQLKLEARKKLKGTGTISDAEQLMLSQAVAALSLDSSEAEYKKQLGIVKEMLENRKKVGTIDPTTGEETPGTNESNTMNAANTDQTSKVNSEDQQALEWANSNPNDPRAQKILEILKRKQSVNSVGGGNVITAPDGQQIEIID